MNETITIISNVGFPIAMCVLLWRYMTTQLNTQRESIEELQKTIAANTLVLSELTTLIKTMRNE